MGQIWEGLQSLMGGSLSLFYDLIPNFGVAIIILTVIVGAILFPLTLKQTRSMKAMQEIQPEIKKIQRELKHDKQAQQQAMMNLYRERGVNPAAGCLPILLQMPIWFALFWVLRSFSERDLDSALRFVRPGSALEEAVTAAVNNSRALDFLWMDLRLSPAAAIAGGEEAAGGLLVGIPYLLLIGVVVFTAYWQQRQLMSRNPQQAQQPGQAIMKIFPLVFGVISYSLPTGLVVYFAASQVFRIGQQALILSMGPGKKDEVERPAKAPPAPKPAEESASSGGGGSKAPPPRETKPKRHPQASKKKRGKKRRRK